MLECTEMLWSLILRVAFLRMRPMNCEDSFVAPIHLPKQSNCGTFRTGSGSHQDPFSGCRTCITCRISLSEDGLTAIQVSGVEHALSQSAEKPLADTSGCLPAMRF